MSVQIVTKQIQARPFRESAFAECQLIRHAAKMLTGDVSERDTRSTIDFLEQMLHHTSEVGILQVGVYRIMPIAIAIAIAIALNWLYVVCS